MQRNVAGMERLASVVLGGLSLSQSLRSNRSIALRTAAGGMGIALLLRGVTGKCAIYDSLDFTTYEPPNHTLGSKLLERSTLVNLPLDEVRSFLEMEETPYGQFDSGIGEDEFEIEIDDRTWRLTLTPHVDQERTLIKASWMIHPIAEVEKEVAAKDQKFIDRLNPLKQKTSRMLDLRILKSLMETGEIASIEGQPHGQRSPFGNFVENFGDFILQKIQSKTALPPEEDHANRSASPVMRKVHA